MFAIDFIRGWQWAQSKLRWLAFAAFLLVPLIALGDLGDWVLEGNVWQKANFGKDKRGSLYVNSTYGVFLYDEETDSWNHIEDFDWDSLISKTNMVYEWERAANTYWLNIVTEQGTFVPKTLWRVSRVGFESRSQGDTILYVSDSLDVRGRISIRVHSFDGLRIWFSLFISNAMSEGPDEGVLCGYFDIEQKTFTFVPLASLELENYPNVTCMLYDGKQVWIGTGVTSVYGIRPGVGLFRFDSELVKLDIYNVENRSLPSNGVIDIIADRDAIWVSTTGGLSAYTPEKDVWHHYQIDHAIATGETEVKATLASKWVLDRLSEGECAIPAGMAFSGDPGNYQYIVELKKPVVGWTRHTKGATTTSEYVYSCPSDTCLRAEDFQWGMKYDVDTTSSKNGWYTVKMGKGVVPRDALKFTISRVAK